MRRDSRALAITVFLVTTACSASAEKPANAIEANSPAKVVTSESDAAKGGSIAEVDTTEVDRSKRTNPHPGASAIVIDEGSRYKSEQGWSRDRSARPIYNEHHGNYHGEHHGDYHGSHYNSQHGSVPPTPYNTGSGKDREE